jgi:phosphoribosylamine-glycine ligase
MLNIAVLSNTASYHHVAKLLSKESTVYHYGAHSSLHETENYCPITLVEKYNTKLGLSKILNDIKHRKIDFLLSSGLELSANQPMQDSLSKLNIPYFFTNIKSAKLEYNKFHAKEILNELKIPTGTSIYNQVTGQFLFDNFYQIPRPFVIKIYQYQYGKQTTVVTEKNYQEVYLDLFSNKLGIDTRITNINDDWAMIIEKFINIKKELSCHYLVNEKDCRYIGSARDYKKIYDGDQGHNSRSLGAYNVNEVNSQIHNYAERIFNYLKTHNYQYKGFLFLGIAIDENDIPVVLEINTRSGDPEINVILESMKNNISELLLAASTNSRIPDIIHDNNKKTVSIRLINSVYNWQVPAVHLPKLTKVPDNICHALEGNEQGYITHSLFTASSNTYENASNSIYTYLGNQDLGQYRYRSDIGILK